MNTNGKTELIMDSLQIRRRQSYEDNAGKYTAEIHYISGTSKHTLTLDEIISERVLAFIGPVICEAAAIVAEEAKKNIVRAIEALNNQAAIEDRPVEVGNLVNAGVSQTAPPVIEHQPPPGGPATPEQWLPSGSDMADRVPAPDSPAMEAEMREALKQQPGEAF